MKNFKEIDIAQKLIRCKSVAPNVDSALKVVEKESKLIGFKCTKLKFSEKGFDTINNLYAEIGDGKPHFSFAGHVDVMDYDTARRFLVFFIYLTNNDKGQTHIIPGGDMFVSSCKKGSMLIFPPMWPWLHRGDKPIETAKYIAGSYLHYV